MIMSYSNPAPAVNTLGCCMVYALHVALMQIFSLLANPSAKPMSSSADELREDSSFLPWQRDNQRTNSPVNAHLVSWPS